MSRRLLLLVPVVLLAAAVGCDLKKPHQPKPDEPTTESAPPTTKPADPNGPSGERTLDYWGQVNRAQEVAARKYAALAEPKADEVAKLLEAAAKVIEDLPTEKVDPDAVAVGQGLAESVRKLAKLVEKEGVVASTEVSHDSVAVRLELAEVARKADKSRGELASRYGHEFVSLDAPSAKDTTFRLAADLGRPTTAQELARLKAESAKLDEQYKAAAKEASAEITERDKLQSAVEDLRNRLKEQKEDVELKRTRQEALDFALKDLEDKKKVVTELTKKRDALQTQKGEIDRLANDLAGLLKDGDPEKVAALPAERLEPLRQRADKLTEKIDALKGKDTTPAPPEKPGK